MNFDSIAILVLSALAAAGKPKGVSLLQELHDKDMSMYKAAIYAGAAALEKLKAVTDKTETKIDDAVVESVSDILQTSAANNGLTL